MRLFDKKVKKTYLAGGPGLEPRTIVLETIMLPITPSTFIKEVGRLVSHPMRLIYRKT